MLLVQVFCGIDWAEDHYDVALVDQAGVVLMERRIDDDAIGYQLLLALLAEHGDDQVEPIPVAIETPRGLVVACLRRTGRQVYAINPLSVARYRERHSVARTKSDRVDAQLLANILRTDRAAHRPLPADSELARAVAVLARAQQDAVWNRQQVANQLRSLLREYYPAFLEAFQGRRPGGLAHPDACAVLAMAPTPTQAARLTRPQLQAALRRAGRQRGITAASVRLQAIFRRTWLHQLSMVEEAMGRQALALLKQLEAAAQAADDLAEATRLVFQQHPQMAIFTSFPGLGELPAARLLAEIGATLRQELRGEDSVFRQGGDEFAVIVPEANAEQAGEMAARLRQQVSRRGPGSDDGWPVSASTGFAMFPADGTTAQDLLGFADMDLFASKRREHLS